MAAPAKYATPRNPSRKTDGARIAAVAAGLGVPLMPWQRQVVDTATERDAAGNLVYEIVLVTVPRQSGKSTLIWTLITDRLLTLRKQRCFYTAQSQQDARRRFADLETLASESPFVDVLKFRRAMSDTGAECLLTGTRATTFAPSFKALHGETPPLVVLDEIFSLSLELGDAMLEGAILPAQQTLAGRRQVWMISTAGTAESEFMKKWVKVGRSGQRPRMAYFEWSMPDGADPYAEETLEQFHPAVGHLVTAADLLESRPESKSAWLRGYCNLWQETSKPLVDLDEWDALPANVQPPKRHEVTVAFETQLDASATSVIAAWRDDAGAHIHTLHTAPGTAWLAPFLRSLRDTWGQHTFYCDNGGTTRRIADELERDGLTINRISATDFASGTGAILEEARTGTLHHDGAITMRRAIAGAQLHRTGDTARISRHASTGIVSPLIAAIVALRAHDHAPRPAPKPTVRF